jgi:hypothetical protein
MQKFLIDDEQNERASKGLEKSLGGIILARLGNSIS